MNDLKAGDYRLLLEPARGGSVARFDWRGEPLFRPTCGSSIFETACFPLVPFSNRIAHGRFEGDDKVVQISPNMPDSVHPHPLHGFGWLSAWDVTESDECSAVIVHSHARDEWPWAYQATQRFSLTDKGLLIELELRNHGYTPMPAGLGFHPYLPRNKLTLYRGLHRGEWQNSSDGLPRSLDERREARDWWDESPVDERTVDTVYTDRLGDLEIDWPDRKIRFVIRPSSNLSYTVVYSPSGADYFCVEPVSHITDAVNRPHLDTGLCWLRPGESTSAKIVMTASSF